MEKNQQNFNENVLKFIDDGMQPLEAIKTAIGKIDETSLQKNATLARHILEVANFYGIDDKIIESEFSEIVDAYKRGTEQYRKEQNIEATKENLINRLSELQNATTLDAQLEKIKEIGNIATTSTEKIDDIAVGINRTPDLQQLWEEAGKKDDTANTITFETLGLPLDRKTLSYIGGRTSRGKTMALVTLGVEALTKGKSVLFVSLEETAEEVMRRFILCYAYFNASDEEKSKLNEEPCTGEINYEGGTKEAYNRLCKYADTPHVTEIFKELVIKARDAIFDFHKKGAFTILNGGGAKFTNLFTLVKSNAKDLILFDYIQLSPSESHSYNDLQRIAAASGELRVLAQSENAIIVSGAQLTRNKTQGGSTDEDEDIVTDESFRSCGDIEQDANTAIGLVGSAKNANLHRIKVLKQRTGSMRGRGFNLDFVGMYSYMHVTGNTFNTDTNTTADNDNSTDETFKAVVVQPASQKTGRKKLNARGF